MWKQTRVSWVLKFYSSTGALYESKYSWEIVLVPPGHCKRLFGGSLKLKFHELRSKFISGEEDNKYFWKIKVVALFC